MNVKICTVLLALALAAPVASMAATVDLDEVFASGDIAQALETEKKFKGTQNGGGGNTQGGNIVVTAEGMDALSVSQAADVDGKLKLKQNGGGGNDQALNLIEGQDFYESAQAAVIGGKVKLAQNGGGGNLQGVNVVNGCENCGDGDGGGEE